MKISCARALLLAASFLPFAAVASERNWQQSTDTQTELWVRDKSEGPRFVVTFRVTTPEGITMDKTVESSGGFASAKFPQVFGENTSLPHGKYKWKGLVESKPVAADEFTR